MGEKTKKPVGLTGVDTKINSILYKRRKTLVLHICDSKCFIAEQSGLPRRNEMKTGAASRAAQADLFTSDCKERLHPPSHKATVDKQARLLVFCEDVKKRLRLLSEVALRTVK